MIDVNGILNALQSPTGRNTAMIGGGAAMAGLATGMLTGKSGRKMIGKAAKYGAVAALGGLAYHAINRRNQTTQGQPASEAASQPVSNPALTDYATPPANSAFLPPADDEAACNRHAQSLIRAMLAAAKADGRITELEQARINDRMALIELDAESRAFLEFEMARPLNVDDVVQSVSCPEHAAELYAASLVAIDADGPVEQAYLKLLAVRLKLEPQLVHELHLAAAPDSPVGIPA